MPSAPMEGAQAHAVTVGSPCVLRIVEQCVGIDRAQLVARGAMGPAGTDPVGLGLMALPFSPSGAECPGSGHRTIR